MESRADSKSGAGRPPAWLWWTVPLLLWLAGSALRIQLTVRDPGFDSTSDRGLLKSDPGLLHYLTQRVLEAEGGVPEDWRADPRIEHPDVVDIPATFTVGQEFLIARAYRAFGRAIPFHVFCAWIMSIVAGAAVVGVFGAVRALTGSYPWASLAGLLYTLIPANYRTVGFLLVREDLSLPLFALHLWALAQAARERHPSAGPWALVATLLLGAALATWHGMGFLVALEGAALLWAFLRRGSHPFSSTGPRLAFLALVPLVGLVPALRAKVPSAPLWMLLATTLWLTGWLPRSKAARPAVRLGATVGTLVLLIGGGLLAGARATGEAAGGDLSHVLSLVLHKVRHLGSYPPDGSLLPFDVRLLWQGPFESAGPAALWAALLLALVLLPVSWIPWPRARGAVASALSAATALSLLAGWLVARTLVLTGLLAPIAVAFAGAKAGAWPPSKRSRLALGVLLVQGVLFVNWARSFQVSWYRPALRQAEIAAMVEALPRLVPPGEAVAADFMNSTAILAHTGRPIVLQPKWETARSRARVERFWNAFYHGTPEDLHALLRDEFDCRYLLVDRFTLWILQASRRVAGFGAEVVAPLPGTAAEALLDPDLDVPGFERIWRSPQTFLQRNGRPSDFFRLYRLVD